MWHHTQKATGKPWRQQMSEQPYDETRPAGALSAEATVSQPQDAPGGQPEPEAEPIRADEPVVLTPVDPTSPETPSAGSAGQDASSGQDAPGSTPADALPPDVPRTMAEATMGDTGEPISSTTAHPSALVRLRDVYAIVENWAARHPAIERFVAAGLKSDLSTAERVNEGGGVAPVGETQAQDAEAPAAGS
jgi:hypothetical protein